MLGLFRMKKAGIDQLGISTDWHCHLLPGVDDGVQTLDDSKLILTHMKAAGLKTVVLTPHINGEMFPANTENSLTTAFGQYLDALPSELKESLDLRLGGEYMVTDGFEKRNMNDLLQIEPGKVLIEMSYLYPSGNMEETIFNICNSGLTPVIAHPERYLYYAGCLEKFERMYTMGALFQLNLLSLGGCYGPGSVRILEYILKNGWYSMVGSDTHTPNHFNNITSLKFKKAYLPDLLSLK